MEQSGLTVNCLLLKLDTDYVTIGQRPHIDTADGKPHAPSKML